MISVVGRLRSVALAVCVAFRWQPEAASYQRRGAPHIHQQRISRGALILELALRICASGLVKCALWAA